MTRLRDCSWTEEDYYWVTKRKLSHLSLDERANFKEAPVLMEFRKERDTDDPNDSCTSYNRRNLYLLAKERDIPIAKFEARHDGVAQEEGKHLAEELFGLGCE